MVRARRGESVRTKVLSTKPLQVVLSLSPESDYRRVRQNLELPCEIVLGAKRVSRGSGLVRNRAKSTFGEPSMAELSIEAQVRVQTREEPANVAVEKVGAVLVAAVDMAKPALEQVRRGLVRVVRLVVMGVAWLGKHHHDFDVGDLRSRSQKPAGNMTLGGLQIASRHVPM